MWLPIILGPLIAVGVIVGLVRGAQALLSNETFMRVMLSRPAAIISTCLFACLVLALLWGFIANPFLAVFIVPFLLLNGGHVWAGLRRRRNAIDDSWDDRNYREPTQPPTEIWRR